MSSGRRTIRLVVEYDGTPFSGWQVQEGVGAPPTVQGALEEALWGLCRERIRVRGASRTDAGVHARGQVVAFETERPNIPAVGFERGLRRFLPPEIAVRRADEAQLGWDPRRSSRGKRYRYTIWNDRTPTALDRNYSWWVRSPLDPNRMLEAGRALLGTHDFEAFRAVGCVARHAVRTLYRVDVRPETGSRLLVEVVGNAFVRNMVRIIAGTLMEVGAGRRSSGAVTDALLSGQRSDAGMTAPACGLCLDEVIYDDRLPPRPQDDSDLAEEAEDSKK